MEQTLIRAIASKVDARQRCLENHNLHWYEEHKITGDKLAETYLPHGSGFNSYSKIDWDRSKSDKIVLFTEFHHICHPASIHHKLDVIELVFLLIA